MYKRLILITAILLLLGACTKSIDKNLIERAKYYNFQNEDEKVVALLSPIRKLNVEGKMLLASSYGDLENYKRSNLLADEVIKDDSATGIEKSLALMIKVNNAYKTSQYENALHLSDEGISFGIFPAAFHMTKAIIFAKRGDFIVAASEFKNVNTDKWPQLYYDVAVYELILGNIEMCFDYLSRYVLIARRAGKKMSAIKEKIERDADLKSITGDHRLQILYDVWADGIDMFQFDHATFEEVRAKEDKLLKEQGKEVGPDFIKKLEEIVTQVNHASTSN